MPKVFLLAATTGYQTRAFGDAAARLGVDLVYATDRCSVLDDPWRDRAVPVRFYDEEGSAAALLEAAARDPIAGVIAVGDRPTVIAARVLEALGLPGHPPEAAATARNKHRSRKRLRDGGLAVPWFVPVRLADDPGGWGDALTFPCVIKPLELSGSRGVMRVDTPAELVAAFDRLRALVRAPDIRAERNPNGDLALIEGFIPGREFALEGLLHHGTLQVLAIFDKPDPLDGPFFEETIYVTPTSAAPAEASAIVAAVAAAARAVGLRHGPIHAECRVRDDGRVFVLEVAARPIGGLCARALRFVGTGGSGPPIPLEELLLRHVLGEDPAAWGREAPASGVMMIPIPRRGIFRRVDGLDAARLVPGVEEVQITAKPDQVLLPLPEGASYLGFIFARADAPDAVTAALRHAHGRLAVAIDPEVPVLQSRHG